MGKGRDELVALLSWQFLARPNGVQVELKIQRRRTGGMDITCVIPSKR
jgi:hypothetical protein